MVSAKIVLYGVRASAPCRSVSVLADCVGIPYESKQMRPRSDPIKSPEFLALNPIGTVPTIEDGDFTLSDSAAIMAYLCDSREVPDHWYPKDLKARARVNRILGWFGSTLRCSGTAVYFNRVIAPMLGAGGSEDIAANYGLPRLRTSLKTMENAFLGGDGDAADAPRWVAGGDDISIADLLLACEVYQDRMLDAAAVEPNYEQLLADYPAVRDWMARVAERTSPHWQSVAEGLDTILDAMLASKKA